MPTTTSQRRTRTQNYRTVGYGGSYSRVSSSAAVREYDYPRRYTGHDTIRPASAPKRNVAENKNVPVKTVTHIKQKRMALNVFVKIAAVFAMCCILLYRYAAILESNDKISKLDSELAAAESAKQAIQAKIDKGLELGGLESYAKTNLGMIYPDNSQIFYIDMQLGDGTQTDAYEEKEKSELALMGTPGALIHAIQVLK